MWILSNTDPIVVLHGGVISAEVLIQNWYANVPEARSQVDALLKQAGLSMDAVMAQTLALKLDEIERIDRMISQAEARRRDDEEAFAILKRWFRFNIHGCTLLHLPGRRRRSVR